MIIQPNSNLLYQQTKDSQEDKDMQTDEDCTEVKSDTEKVDIPIDNTRTSLDEDSSKLAQAAAVPLPCDAEDSNDDEKKLDESAENSGMLTSVTYEPKAPN